MIFLGDLACPTEKKEELIACLQDIEQFRNEVIILNFEGDVIGDEFVKEETLYNVEDVLDGFSKANKVIVCLANNHTYDYSNSIEYTESVLENHNVESFGLVKDGKISPFEFCDNNEKIAIFGHCWNLYTKTNVNRINSIKVVDCDYSQFISTVSKYKQNHQNTSVYCFMHWNYDLEILPFPMHRKIAHALIDNGIDGIIASHPHVVQGAELYKGKPVAYSLGNFYIPSGYYFGGRLVYPEESKRTYAVQINGGNVSILWFNTDKDKPLEYIGKETILEGRRISEISPFRNMSDKEYIKYFRKYRRKKILVPIFDDYIGIGAKLKEEFAILRVKLIRMIK